MELKELVATVRKHTKLISSIVLVTGILGVALHFIVPTAYYAEGTFYVSGFSQPSTTEYFAYDGYYAQQSAQSYTQTLAALFESVTLHSAVLDQLAIPVTENALRAFSKRLSVRIQSPQLVRVIYKSNSPDVASAHWQTLADVVTAKSTLLNDQGVSQLAVVPVHDYPVVKRGYSSVYLAFAIGAGLGLVAVTIWITLKEYYAS